MTYENWCKHSTEILAEAEKYNKWRSKAKTHLLTKIGPLLERLRKSGYMGCGFHYSLEHTFGNLIVNLAKPWQPSANHCNKVEDQRDVCMTTEVIYESLMEQIEEAKNSVAEFKQK